MISVTCREPGDELFFSSSMEKLKTQPSHPNDQLHFVAPTPLMKISTSEWSPGRLHGSRNLRRKGHSPEQPANSRVITHNRFSVLEDENLGTHISGHEKEKFKERSKNQNLERSMENSYRNNREPYYKPPSMLPSYPRDIGNQRIDKFLNIKIHGGLKNRERMFREIKKNINLNRGDISELRDGSLLIKSRSTDTTQKLLSLKKIANTDVTIAINQRLSQSRCTIYATSLLQHSESELAEDFEDRGVVEVRRIKKRINGDLIDTPIHILTFDSLEPPDQIYHGWVKYSTRRYIPRPRQCFNCFKFGHIAIACRTTEQICINCARTKHTESRCGAPTECALCGGDHTATSKACPHYKLHNRTQEIKEIEKTTHREAFTRAQLETGFSRSSYSRVLREGQPRPSKGNIRSTASTSIREEVNQRAPRLDSGSRPHPRSPRSHLLTPSPRRTECKTKTISLPEDPTKNKSKGDKPKGKKMRHLTEDIREIESSDDHSSPTKRKVAPKQCVKNNNPSKDNDATPKADCTETTKEPTERNLKYDKIEKNLAALHGFCQGDGPSRTSQSIISDLPWPPGFTPPRKLSAPSLPVPEVRGQPIKVQIQPRDPRTRLPSP